MSLYEGDQVCAIADIGGFAREFIPAGTPGVVATGGGVLRRARVAFFIPGGWLSSDRQVLVEVDPCEVEVEVAAY